MNKASFFSLLVCCIASTAQGESLLETPEGTNDLSQKALTVLEDSLQLPPNEGSLPSLETFYGRHPQYEKLEQLLAYYKTMVAINVNVKPFSSAKNHPQRDALVRGLVKHGFLSPVYLALPIKEGAVLETALKRFQKNHRLKVTGIVDEATATALNADLKASIEVIIQQLEKWRALKVLKKKYIVVNIPSFTLYGYRENVETLFSRVVVGKPRCATPEMTTFIQSIMTHPVWMIPTSQINRLKENVGSRGYAWSQGRLIQKAGPHNSLGNVKFITNHTGGILLHGTNQPKFFQDASRAQSLGCIRVEDTLALLSFLFYPEQKASLEQIRSSLEHNTTRIFSIREKVPVYIVYMTLWIDPEGYPLWLENVYKKSIDNKRSISKRQQEDDEDEDGPDEEDGED